MMVVLAALMIMVAVAMMATTDMMAIMVMCRWLGHEQLMRRLGPTKTFSSIFQRGAQGNSRTLRLDFDSPETSHAETAACQIHAGGDNRIQEVGPLVTGGSLPIDLAYLLEKRGHGAHGDQLEPDPSHQRRLLLLAGHDGRGFVSGQAFPDGSQQVLTHLLKDLLVLEARQPSTRA